MTHALRSAKESSPPITVFESGSGPRATTTTSCKVFAIEAYMPVEVLPPDSEDFAAVVARWERDPIREAAMAAARQELGEMLQPEGHDSIRAMRLRRGLSQVQLAALLGTSQSHIARIESGTLKPNLDTCQRIATAFQVDMNTIAAAILGGFHAEACR